MLQCILLVQNHCAHSDSLLRVHDVLHAPSTRQHALVSMHLTAAEPVELSLSVVDDRGIQKLNRQWRGIDKATDVLSYPAATEFDHVRLPQPPWLAAGRCHVGRCRLHLATHLSLPKQQPTGHQVLHMPAAAFVQTHSEHADPRTAAMACSCLMS